MKFTREPLGNYIYTFDFPYDKQIVLALQELRKSGNGADLQYKQGTWRFSDLGWVAKIKTALPELLIDSDEGVVKDLEKYAVWKAGEFDRLNRIFELKNTFESDFVVNNIKGSPWGYQRVGVEFMEATEGRCIIADEMGTGKTMQSLCYVAHKKIEKTIVVCPAIAKSVWFDEVHKWTNLRPIILSSKTKLTMEMWNNHDVFIINYDIIGKRGKTPNKFYEFFSAVRVGMLIADECHRIKNTKSARTKSVVGLSRKIPHFLALSGTPMLNRPSELFTVLNILNPADWGDEYAFNGRYCQVEGKKTRTVYYKDKKGKAKSRKVQITDGASNLDELRKRINGYYIRRTKDKVLPFLPPKIETRLAIELDPDTKKLYRESEEAFIASLESGEGVNGFTQLNELRMLSSIGKIEKVTEFVEDLIRDQKVIIFSSFNEPLRQLRDYFGDKSVYVTGEVATDKRKELEDRFCNTQECRIFLGGTIAAGEALTLVEARSTIFIDYPWVPGQKDQASDRNHRPGAEKHHDSLNIYQMYTPGSVDERMAGVIYNKRQVFDALFDKDPSKAEESARKAIIASYMKGA